MYTAQGTGKNIEQAIDNALFELKATRDDVDIKILSEGGLFKKAKVEVSISADALEKYKARNEKSKVEEKPVKEEIKAEEISVLPLNEKVKPVVVESEIVVEREEIKDDNKNAEEKVEKTVDPEEFLKGLFASVGKDVEIEVTEDGKYVTYAVKGEDLGAFIGHRGECFYAIQRMVNIVAGRTKKKILIDIGSYREKRQENLTALAKRTASKVVSSGRYIKLEPMNPADRRIIHSALADNDKVTTLSKGEEPNRYVIIFQKEM